MNHEKIYFDDLPTEAKGLIINKFFETFSEVTYPFLEKLFDSFMENASEEEVKAVKIITLGAAKKIPESLHDLPKMLNDLWKNQAVVMVLREELESRG